MIGSAMTLMSSGTTWVRPWLTAQVFAQRTKARHPRVDVHLVGQPGHVGDHLRGEDRAQTGGAVAAGRVGQHRHGGLVVGVAQRRLHEEAVELGLGQAIGAGLLDGVLGRDDHEGAADAVGLAVDGDT